ncbi:MAG: FAD-dependent oxidoreductase [Bilophila wadsworthia]
MVGSGPAGLTAARFATLLGHAVTVYESAPVMGGVPRHAVPDFRLPKDVVDRETGAIVASGVQVRTNVTVGRDITLQSLLDTYDATILAVGLWKERRLDIPGKEHLVPAVGWLKRSTLERQSLAGKTVVILGGGGVALTAPSPPAASTPMPYIVCLEPTDAMRTPAEEVQQAPRRRHRHPQQPPATPSPRKADAFASRPGP